MKQDARLRRVESEPARLHLGSAPSYGSGSTVLGEGEVHLLDYFKVIYKRRWSAIAAFVVIVGSVTVYTFTATPIYEGRVQVLIEKENANVVNFKEVFEQNQIADDYYQTQYKILQSRSLARRTLESVKAWDDPSLASKPKASSYIAELVQTARAMAVSLVKGANGPAALPEPGETVEQSRTIDGFLGNLTIAPIRNSRLVDVRYQTTDAARAAMMANALAKNYIEQDLEFKFMASKEASDWLSERLSEQRKKVEASEVALQKYRESNDAVSLEERQNIVVQKLNELNTAVTRAKTERIQKEALYNQIRAIQNDRNALDTFPAILGNTFIQQQKSEIADLQRQQAQLSEKLGPNHPDMLRITRAILQTDAKLQGEIAKVVQSLRNDFQAAAIQERNLTVALDQQKGDALALNRKGIEYGAIQRDAVSNRQIFESLMQRTKETGIAGELKTSNIRVIDPAEVPRRPVRPNRSLNLMFALLGGTVFSVGLALFLEYLDNRIKTPDELKASLGLPFLGMVPALFEEAAKSPTINNGVPANFSEAFRAIRTNVLFSGVDAASRSMVITSTGPGEGKTVVSANLAIALAQAGQRVILIDADMRKPRVHAMFSCAQEPGLSNVLAGSDKASETIKAANVPGLWVLPAGRTPPNPAELLGSKRFDDFLAALQGHFDWLVIDTPPVMAVTDSAIVAHNAHGVIFVVGAEMTSRHIATRAIEQLESAKARFIGAVLNRVDLKHNAYYYSQYYHSDYGSYYASEHTKV